MVHSLGYLRVGSGLSCYSFKKRIYIENAWDYSLVRWRWDVVKQLKQNAVEYVSKGSLLSERPSARDVTRYEISR